MTPKDVLTLAQENKVIMVDFKFIDFPGIWQNFSVPVSELEESTFEDGAG
ncbi:MAG TPA: glutamine synthetase, partial [Nitrospirae bacterium]|nr:glutamine synthetase [Nitrospirota bacterium]